MPIPMTVEGMQALRDELSERKQVLRPEITQAIAEAREHGGQGSARHAGVLQRFARTPPKG